MKEGLADLLPSRAYAKRMLDLEAELKRARAFQRRHSKSPETLGRWGLEQPPEAQEGESWFLTYLDMMTLLLVVMIVMFAFSGGLNRGEVRDTVAEVTHVESSTATVAGARPSADGASAEDTPPAPGGNGLLPGGSGLLPGHGNAVDALAASETLPGWKASWGLASPFPHPADVGPLPRDAQVQPHVPAKDPADRPPVQVASRSINEMYPGWSAADLAASFVGPPKPPTALADQSPDPAAPISPEPAPTPSSMSEGEEMAASLALGDLGNDVQVIVSERSVSFRVNSEILFDSSQADLSRSGLSVLRRIVSVLSGTEHEITVEGHTDSVPVRRNVRYPSNWELSSARAGSVVRYLQANGIERHRLRAVGYADTRPIGDNHTPEGRATNRRVELIIEKRD